MSLKDPYYDAASELTELVSTAESAIKLNYSSINVASHVTDAKKKLQELKGTVEMLVGNLERFKVSEQEFQNRTYFCQDMESRLQALTEQINSQPAKQAQSTAMTQRERLMKGRAEDNDRFIDTELEGQQVLMRRQDVQLDQLGNDVMDVRHLAHEIGGELESSARELDDVNNHMDRAQNKIDTLNDKLKEFANKPRTWFIIGCVILTALLLAMIIYLICMD